MRRLHLLPSGLIARLVAILLATLMIEFAASTLIYEQAGRFSVREDEARRLAEHLVIARRLVSEQPVARRTGMANELTTDRYFVRWSATKPRLPTQKEQPGQIRDQILAWEPTLAAASVEAQTLPRRGSTIVAGTLRLGEGDWLFFRTIEPLQTNSATYSRILSSVITVALLMLLGGLFIRQTLQPIRALTDAVERFGPELRPSPPVELQSGTGDVQRLMDAFNAMQARIRRLVDERTRALVAVSHDLRTPLARLRLRVDAVEDDALRREVEADLDGMEAMVTSLLAFLGGDEAPEQGRLIDLAVLCGSIVDDACDHGHHVRYTGPAHLEVTVRQTAMQRAIVNLVDNAVRYGDRVTLELEVDNGVAIHVKDNGPGIPDESMLLVREPFVRLDDARQRDEGGFGLGLSIVERVVSDENGALTLVNLPEGGLCASIRLPPSILSLQQ